MKLLFKRNLEAVAKQVRAEIGIKLEARRYSSVRVTRSRLPPLLRGCHESPDEFRILLDHIITSNQARAIGDQPIFGIRTVFCVRQAAAGAQIITRFKAGQESVLIPKEKRYPRIYRNKLKLDVVELHAGAREHRLEQLCVRRSRTRNDDLTPQCAEISVPIRFWMID